jgi:MSHA pilin protein MshA
VILGILAATALPKFANMQVDARKASLDSAYGAVNSAIGIVHSQALLKNALAATGTVTLETGTVNVVYGYPKATVADFQAAINLSTSDFTLAVPSAGTLTIDIANATTPASCRITYTEATSATVPGSAAKVDSAC